MQHNKKIISIYFYLNKNCLYLRMDLQEIAILRKHFIDVFDDNINEDVDYLCVKIFDVIQDLGGLNGLLIELINDTEWDFNTNHYLKSKYLQYEQ